MPDDLKPIHVLNRLAFGPRPGDVDRVKLIGVERYIHEQLHPDSVPEPDFLTNEIAALNTIRMNPIDLFRDYQRPLMQARRAQRGGTGANGAGAEADPAVRNARLHRRTTIEQAIQARIVRAVEGPRQLQEVMTDFWFNHFNVFAGKGIDLIWVGAYEQQAIRPHALGRFRDLLGATAKHPAMLFYLDNWQNTAPGSPGARGKQEGINENYARELMELHTLGVNGGYTQQDVIALAHILTGWGFPRPAQLRRGANAVRMRRRGRMKEFEYAQPVRYTSEGFFFDERRHDFGDKVFLGRTIKGGGVAEGEHALDILARSAATSHHLSFELAQYFVADAPPEPLVKRMASRYMETDGEIREVLASIFSSAEFWDARYREAKFKTPYQYVISAVRATGIQVRNFRPLYGTMAQLGMPLYGCQTPDGYKNTQEAWLNPDAMMRRLDFATALGTGRLRIETPPMREEGGMAGMKPAAMGGATGDIPDAAILAATIGGHLSEQTASALGAAPAQLRAAVLLGSPEFMRS